MVVVLIVVVKTDCPYTSTRVSTSVAAAPVMIMWSDAGLGAMVICGVVNCETPSATGDMDLQKVSAHIKPFLRYAVTYRQAVYGPPVP